MKANKDRDAIMKKPGVCIIALQLTPTYRMLQILNMVKITLRWEI